ncbi:nuclear transport factor 2 family protein [Flavobacterium sp. J27]|uniref:nuclear transport factor 2 family protein n=1 Tax=Flavobacterium sp. J27 TaxID=2060419 RepID=UPI00102FAB98|nr:nuclear transport factor 2 family protein [Flavobacterium sp. J27]
MTNKEQIQKFYLEDGIRNVAALEEFLHDDVILEWSSSDGVLNLSKQAILNLALELKQNYDISIVEITHLIEENNTVVVKYNQKIATIENPSELIPIAKFIVIWEFLENKLFRGYQISQPV